jgi:hypothetical protein
MQVERTKETSTDWLSQNTGHSKVLKQSSCPLLQVAKKH